MRIQSDARKRMRTESDVRKDTRTKMVFGRKL